MDILAIDLRSVSDCSVGDEVTLWGEEYPIELLAKATQRSPYEILVHVNKSLDRCIDKA
jgi:alanine racemase